MPERIQYSRKKGWRKPEGAIYVGRPTKWGNPYRIAMRGGKEGGRWWVVIGRGTVLASAGEQDWTKREAAEVAVEKYRDLHFDFETGKPKRSIINRDAEIILGGHDLGCWCPIEDEQGRWPCHADELLKIANP